MIRKILAASIILLVGASLAGAQTAKVRKPVKKKPAIVKKIVKPVAPQIVKPQEPAAESVDEKLADLKEDTNKALAELKSSVDKVKSDNSDAKVSGVVFFRWQKYTQNSTTPNNFDVDRAYLDFKKKLAGNSAVRVTLDVRRLDSSLDANKKTQNLLDYLKYAYFETPVPIPSAVRLIPFDLTAKVGLQHTCWIDWADKMLNLRYISKSLVDNEGVMSSADFGLGAVGKVSLPGIPEIEYHGTLLNGTGYAKAEDDSKKYVGLRLNSTVYDGGEAGKVILGGFGHIAGINSSLSYNGSNKQVGAMLGYKHEIGTAYFEYLYGTGIAGNSLGGIVTALPGLNIFARLDQYDPNRSKASDQIDRTFYGVTYDWNKDIKLALDMQSATYGSAASSNAGKTVSAIYLHTMVTI